MKEMKKESFKRDLKLLIYEIIFLVICMYFNLFIVVVDDVEQENTVKVYKHVWIIIMYTAENITTTILCVYNMNALIKSKKEKFVLGLSTTQSLAL